MTVRVSLAGGGRAFEVHGRESVLDAAIRAGLHLDYGCNTGLCGRCRARVVSGRVEALRPTDYGFSPKERAEGYVLLCSVTPVSDVVIELPGTVPRRIEPQRYAVKVRHVDRLGEDLVLFRVATARTQRMRFYPGQSVRFLDGPVLSIASCPCEPRLLEFHLRRGPTTDPTVEAFLARLRMGRGLELEGPYGARVVDEAATHPLLFIAFDTGFAAVKSLVEHVTAQEHERPLCLAWFTCSAQGPYLHNLCRSWQDAFDAFRYEPISLYRAGGGADAYDTALEQVAARCEAPERWEVYASVPERLEAVTRAVLLRLGFGAMGLRIEPATDTPDVACLLGASHGGVSGALE